MPAGRAERAVEAPAKSIDGAEPSGMLSCVMAAVQIDAAQATDPGDQYGHGADQTPRDNSVGSLH